MNKIPFLTNKIGWVAVGLMILQLVVKLTVELGKAMEATNPVVVPVAIVFTIGWVMIIALCIAGFRLGYWLGAIWGLLHFVLTIPLPLMEACDHYVFAAFVAVHGILIAAACVAVLLIDAREKGSTPYRAMSKSTVTGFILLCISVLVRLLWITFREPIGAEKALTAMTGRGGIPELAANSLLYVVILSMIALCVITPGIIMTRRWAFVAAAIFGSVHIVLIVLLLIFHVNQGIGPAIVLPASFGNLIGGIWMMNSHPQG